jgi:hypothetical protein
VSIAPKRQQDKVHGDEVYFMGYEGQRRARNWIRKYEVCPNVTISCLAERPDGNK